MVGSINSHDPLTDRVSVSTVVVTGPTELTVSSLAVAVTNASTRYAYPRRDGQAELAWLAELAWRDYNTINIVFSLLSSSSFHL